MKFNSLIKSALLFAAVIALFSISAFAQCAMCKANIANAENAAEVSGTINTAVLVLLVPTLLVIGGIVRLVFTHRHAANEDSSSPVNSYVNFRPPDTQRHTQ